VAQGAGDADRDEILLLVKNAAHTDYGIGPQQLERGVRIIQADGAFLQHFENELGYRGDIRLDSQLKCLPGRDARADTALLLAQKRLVQLQLFAPERFAAECFVPEDLLAFVQHVVRALTDLVVPFLARRGLSARGRVGLDISGKGSTGRDGNEQ
jgi:hypothetical protein